LAIGTVGLLLPSPAEDAEARGALGGKMGGRHGKDHRGRDKNRGKNRDDNDNNDEPRDQNIFFANVALYFMNQSSSTVSLYVTDGGDNTWSWDDYKPGGGWSAGYNGSESVIRASIKFPNGLYGGLNIAAENVWGAPCEVTISDGAGNTLANQNVSVDDKVDVFACRVLRIQDGGGNKNFELSVWDCLPDTC